MKELQNGRSMIEMLGVLAIIGVLSIGGLAGYTMAMNRHKANTMIDEAMKCGVIAQTAHETMSYDGTDCTNTALLGTGAAYTSYGTIKVTRPALTGGAQGNTFVVIAPTAEGVQQALRSRSGKTGNSFTYILDTQTWS